MEILELPDNINTTIHCDCGCVFEFTAKDVELKKIHIFGRKHIETAVNCPICGHRHVIWTSIRIRQSEGDE